jgi:hypothetical protein
MLLANPMFIALGFGLLRTSEDGRTSRTGQSVNQILSTSDPRNKKTTMMVSLIVMLRSGVLDTISSGEPLHSTNCFPQAVT